MTCENRFRVVKIRLFEEESIYFTIRSYISTGGKSIFKALVVRFHRCKCLFKGLKVVSTGAGAFSRAWTMFSTGGKYIFKALIVRFHRCGCIFKGLGDVFHRWKCLLKPSIARFHRWKYVF